VSTNGYEEEWAEMTSNENEKGAGEPHEGWRATRTGYTSNDGYYIGLHGPTGRYWVNSPDGRLGMNFGSFGSAEKLVTKHRRIRFLFGSPDINEEHWGNS